MHKLTKSQLLKKISYLNINIAGPKDDSQFTDRERRYKEWCKAAAMNLFRDVLYKSELVGTPESKK